MHASICVVMAVLSCLRLAFAGSSVIQRTLGQHCCRNSAGMPCAGKDAEPSPIQDTFTSASPRLGSSVSPTPSSEAEAQGASAAAEGAPHQEGGEHGKKEHGSLFASARAFFKRKEADSKH